MTTNKKNIHVYDVSDKTLTRETTNQICSEIASDHIHKSLILDDCLSREFLPDLIKALPRKENIKTFVSSCFFEHDMKPSEETVRQLAAGVSDSSITSLSIDWYPHNYYDILANAFCSNQCSLEYLKLRGSPSQEQFQKLCAFISSRSCLLRSLTLVSFQTSPENTDKFSTALRQNESISHVCVQYTMVNNSTLLSSYTPPNFISPPPSLSLEGPI